MKRAKLSPPQVYGFEKSLEEMLTRVDEFVGMLDMVCLYHATCSHSLDYSNRLVNFNLVVFKDRSTDLLYRCY